MKKIFWSLMILGVLFTSCRKNSTEKEGNDGDDEVTSRNLTDEQSSFKAAFEGFMEAFRAKDYGKLNEFVSADDGIYVIYKPDYGGAYNDFVQFDNMEELANSKELDETLTYFEQALASGQILEGEIIYEELDDIDPCDYAEMKVSADYGSTDIISKTYADLENQTGEEPDADKLAQIKACEKDIKIKVYVGVGEEAEVLYFANKNDKWTITVIDLGECGG